MVVFAKASKDIRRMIREIAAQNARVQLKLNLEKIGMLTNRNQNLIYSTTQMNTFT